MLNKIFIQGRMTKNPELRTTQSGKPVASFTVAVDRDYDREKCDFFNCVAWGKQAEFVSKFFEKGQMAVVSGSMQSRSWTDRENKKRLEWEVQAESIHFCGEKRKASPDISAADFEELEDEEEMPF